MSKKRQRGGAPVPAGNQPRFGPERLPEKPVPVPPEGAPASEQDSKRRLGNYGTAGEHPIEQPDGKQGANR